MTNLLDMRLEDLPEEKPAPEGPYEGVVQTYFIKDFENEEGTKKRVDVVIGGIAPLFEGDFTDVNFKSARATKSMWLTAAAAKMFRKDMEALGADMALTPTDALDALKGRRVKFKLKHDVNPTSKKVYLNADNVRALAQTADAAE